MLGAPSALVISSPDAMSSVCATSNDGDPTVGALALSMELSDRAARADRPVDVGLT